RAPVRCSGQLQFRFRPRDFIVKAEDELNGFPFLLSRFQVLLKSRAGDHLAYFPAPTLPVGSLPATHNFRSVGIVLRCAVKVIGFGFELKVTVE
ncbi:MAG: hypothetical protein ACREDQ_02730, partial [Limisphaerales bacterium]